MIKRIENKIEYIGPFGISEIHPFFGTVHDAICKRGYPEITLDFSRMTAAFAGPMLSVCAKALSLEKEHIDVNLILPSEPTLAKLFINTNWASIISPRHYEPSTFRGYTHVPTILFKDHSEQAKAVNKVLDAILSSIKEIHRQDLAAVEWSVNEITDNVLVHSESKIGGLLQLSSFSTRQKRIEYVVCDAGIGIPDTLRSALDLHSDLNALEMSIKEGITNGKGAGNGLYGSFQTSLLSGGYFHLHSGNASLISKRRKTIPTTILSNERVPFKGTLVVSCLDYSVPSLLENALVFGGKKCEVTDFIEMHYEDELNDHINFVLSNESESFGTRPAGIPIKNKLLNLLSFYPTSIPIIIDFADVPLLSSSFADEVFGKLFLEIGEKAYRTRIVLRNCDRMNSMLIERSLHQRKEKMCEA